MIAEFAIAQKIARTVSAAADLAIEFTGISRQTVRRLQAQVRKRGFNPDISPKLTLDYGQDAPRSGRPGVVTPALESTVLEAVRASRHGREKSSITLGYEHGVSASTILNILHKHQFKSCKTTKKPSLTAAMKEARLQFCLRYQD